MLRTILSLVVVATIGMTGCGASSQPATGGRRTVVAAFFPLAEAVRQMGGDRVRVRDLTPSGAEPHDLELTPDQVDAIDSADLVIVMGHGFQPAVEDVAWRRKSHALFVLDALGITGDAAKDPHVWLDPVLMARVYALVGDRLGHGDAAVAAQLGALGRDFSHGLANCARRTIVTAHAAFGWLARRYGLTQESIAGLDPEQEPGADRIAQLADLARRERVTTIFTETLVSSRVADALAREAGGLRTAVLDPIESADAKLGGYLDRMRRNLGALESALGCT